jgi:streptogramin lyase
MIRRSVVAVALGLFLGACSHASGTVPAVSSLASSNVGPAVSNVKFFKIPTSFSWPEYITNGPDGNLWFTEFYARKVARITPAGVVTEFALPQNDDVEAIVTGPDKNLWFTEPGANKIGRMTTGGLVTDFPIHGSDPSPRGIAVGPDGNLWFAEYYDDHIGRITPSGTITRFAVPTGSSPWEIMAGPDGNLWITESTTDRIDRFNPRTQTFLASIALKSGDNPWALTIGPNHNVWFTGRHGGTLGVIKNGNVTEFKIPTQGAYPDDLTVGQDGNFWFTESLKNGIGRFNPRTGKFLARIVLSTKDIPTSITAGPDHNIWFTNPSYAPDHNLIGVVTLP